MISENQRQQLILASTSPRRKKILEQINQDFIVKSPSYNEGIPKGDPVIFVKQAAQEKAKSIVKHCRLKAGLVLAADTLVVRERIVYGKPKNRQEAEKMIRLLAGKKHSVLTGVALLDLDSFKMDCWVEETKVVMRSLAKKEIDDYIMTGAWKGKAGAYGVQDQAAAFISRIEGCYFNVVGLPLARLTKELFIRGLR